MIGRGRPHDDGPGVLVERPLQLAHRLVDVGQRDVGGGEDAVPVGHAPVLGQPAVEGAEQQHDGARVVLERLLVEHAEGGEEPDLGQALGVHGGEAGVAVAVLGADGLGLAHQLVHGPTVGVAPEVVDQRPGRRDRVERRVGDGPADPAAQRVVAPAADLDPLDHPRPELRVEVAGERIERLVVVVVGVEDGRVDSVHGQPSASVRNTADSIGCGSAARPRCGPRPPGRPPTPGPRPSAPRRPARAAAAAAPGRAVPAAGPG